MRPVVWLAVVGLGLGLAQGAGAQPRRGQGDATTERREAGPATTERREQIKKKIRALRAYTLTEELALDEQTAGRLFPVLARFDDETDRLLEKRVDVQRRLRRADSLRDGRAIERLIDEAVANQRGFWELEDKRLAELRKILTPIQAARLLVVLPALVQALSDANERQEVLPRCVQEFGRRRHSAPRMRRSSAGGSRSPPTTRRGCRRW
jgi:hypothetical protein